MAEREQRKFNRRAFNRIFVVGGASLVFGGVDLLSGCSDGGDPLKSDGAATAVTPVFEGIKPLTVKLTREDWHDLQRNTITIDANSYRQEGGRIREIIRDLEAKGDRGVLDVDRVYEQLKKANRGVEYLNGGEVFDPKVGDQHWLDDPDRRRGQVGIKLRQSAQMWGSIYDGYVFDGARVEIIGEPVSEVIDKPHVNTVWYPVKVVDVSSGFVSDATADEGTTGFVEKKWLGDRASKAPAQK